MINEIVMLDHLAPSKSTYLIKSNDRVHYSELIESVKILPLNLAKKKTIPYSYPSLIPLINLNNRLHSPWNVRERTAYLEFDLL